MADHPFPQTRWSLQDLLPATEGPAFEQILADLEAAVSALEASRSQLSPDLPTEEFVRQMTLVEKIATLGNRSGM